MGDRKLDFSDCTFKWNWRGPRPPAIRHMVEERAFKSFGPDPNVIKNVWTQPVVTGAIENKVFPREPDDICCADTVGWCAYQSRVVDFLVTTKMNVHWVDSYFPFKKTVHGNDFAKLVGVYGPEFLNAPFSYDNFLPGDYFIYSRVFDWIAHANHKHPPRERIAMALEAEEGKVETVGDHINMWLGPFTAYDKDGNEAGHFDQINGSWGLSGSSYYVLPVNSSQYWTGYEWKQGTCVIHCRFKQIEALFRDVLGAPMRPPPPVSKSSSSSAAKGKGSAKDAGPAVKQGPSADLDAFWDAIRDARAPYPVGTHLGWHQGVHVLEPVKVSEDDRTGEVFPIAPGQIVAARGASPNMPEGDSSFVLVKHQLAKKTKQVIDPTSPDAASADPKQPFFSLYMHLAPVSAFMGEKKQGDALPPLKDEAPGWLRALWPRPLPGGTVPKDKPITVLAPKGGDPKNGFTTLGAPPNLKVLADVPADKLTKVKADGVEYYVLPQPDTGAAAWVQKPTVPAAQGELMLFNPRTGQVYRTHVRFDGAAHLFVQPDAADASKLRLVVEKVGDAEYAHVDVYGHPALRLTGRANDFTSTEDPAGGGKVLVLPPKASKGDSWDVFLSSSVVDGKAVVKGPNAALRFADIVDADAEQKRKDDDPDDKTTHTTVGVREPMVPPDPTGKSGGWMWLDLVPCVKLTKSKDDIEQKLNDDQVRIQRGVAERLAAGTSRLMGVVTSTKDDAAWTLEADGYTLDASASSPVPPPLYAGLKARGNGFVVDDDPKKKPKDGTWKLEPPGAAGASLHAVAITPGWQKGTSEALVEIVHVVPAAEVDAETKKRADEVKVDNDKRVQVVNDLIAGKVVDVRKRVADPIRIGRESIGAFGRLVGAPGTTGDQHGVHVEVFSGKPLAVDGDPSIADKKLSPLAGSPWLALKDASEDDLLSAKAARLLVKELAAHGGPSFQKDVLATMPPADDAADWQPPTLEEWLSFCKSHERPLARVVSVHPSEWALDWPEALGKDGSIKKPHADDIKEDAKRVHGSLAWTKDVALSADDDGIADPKAIVFHHPARLVELLRTGIEVSVSTRKGAASKAKATFTPAGEAPIQLAALDDKGRFGALVATSEAIDVSPAIVGTVDVQFDGGSPKPLKFENVRVVRGATTHLSVVSAWVETTVEWPHAKKSYAVDYSEGPPRLTHANELEFLADGGKYLGEDGYGRVHLRVTAHYNTKAPTFGNPTLKRGGQGFAIDAASIKRWPETTTTATDDPAQPTSLSAQVAYVEFDVLAKPGAIGAADEVSVSVSGEELDGDQSASWKLVTRSITPGDDGPDVAQLQLYLALILALDGLPCYRGDPEAAKAAAIDGDYGGALRSALWRFCYCYAGSKGWAAQSLTVVKGKDAKTAKAAKTSSSVSMQDLVSAAASHGAVLQRAPTGPSAVPDEVLSRLGDKGDEWVVVDSDLVKSVVAVFGAGHAVPQGELHAFAVRPQLPLPLADGPKLSFPNVEDGWARALTWDGFHVWCRLTGDAKDGVDANGQIEITVPDKSPYNLAAPGGAPQQKLTTTAAAISAPNAFVFELVPIPGAHWTGKDAPQLVATWKGGRNWQVSQRHLREPRDFLQKWEDKGDAGLDATVVQFCLSQAPHPATAGAKPRGYVPAPKSQPKKKDQPPPERAASIDGVWSDGWVKALKEYATEWGLAQKSEVLVPALLAHVLKGTTPSP